MTTMIRIAPIVKSVRVRATPDRAFEIFTTNVARWWPPSYTIGQSPIKQVVIEPRTGGSWYEIGEDGSECRWGDVLAWSPPTGLMLAWRIGMDWQFDPSLLTELEITFKDVGDGETEVRLEHRKLENLGDGAEKAVAILDGWGNALIRYADVVQGASQVI
jgi:uncharacterized protein YndB with AHSA1/START domain